MFLFNYELGFCNFCNFFSGGCLVHFICNLASSVAKLGVHLITLFSRKRIEEFGDNTKAARDNRNTCTESENPLLCFIGLRSYLEVLNITDFLHNDAVYAAHYSLLKL